MLPYAFLIVIIVTIIIIVTMIDNNGPLVLISVFLELDLALRKKHFFLFCKK